MERTVVERHDHGQSGGHLQRQDVVRRHDLVRRDAGGDRTDLPLGTGPGFRRPNRGVPNKRCQLRRSNDWRRARRRRGHHALRRGVLHQPRDQRKLRADQRLVPGLHLRDGRVGLLDTLQVRDRVRAPQARGRAAILKSVAACLMALGPVVPSFAGIGAGNGEIGADYALQKFDPDFDEGTGSRLSLRGGPHRTRWLQWEVQVTHASVEEEPLPGATRKITLSAALVNAVFNFHPRADVVPYLLAGLGLASMELEAVGLSESDTAAGYQIAGGSRFFFGQGSPVALRIELGILGNDAFENTYFHPSVAAGLTFRLGREPGTGAAP